MNENWDKWEEEKPDWFSTKTIIKIPQDMLPVKVLENLGATKKERRESMDKLIKKEATEEKRKASITSEDPPVVA